MNDPFVRQVREAVDLVEVVGQYVQLKRAGKSWKGRCPFHEEKTPSFNVNAEQQLFYCFGCQKGGDVFKFLMELEHLTFPEALERMATRAGLAMPRRSPGTRAESGLAQVVEWAVRFYEDELRHPERGREGRSFLKDRGIRAETVVQYRLGLAGAGWENLARASEGKWAADALLKAGLCVQREGGPGIYDRLRRRVVIPILSTGGVPVALAGRALAEGEVKYLNTSESDLYHKSSVLYGLPQARPAIRQKQRALLVEGYLDVLTLHQAGFLEAVASSGTALTAEHGKLLRRHTDQVTVVYDGDDAGRNAAFRALRPLLRAGIRPKIALLEGGVDPDSMVRDLGPAALESALEHAADWLAAVRRHPGLPDRSDARVDAVAGLLAEVEDDLLRASFTKEAAQEFSFFEEVLRNAVEQRRLAARGPLTPPERGPRSAVLRRGPEWQFLRWLYHRPDLLEHLSELVTPEWFEGPGERELLELLRRRAAEPLAEADERLLPLSAEPIEEGQPEEEGLHLAVSLEDRRLRRLTARLREGLRDIAEGPLKHRQLEDIQSVENRIQELRARGPEVLFEVIEGGARGVDPS